MKTFQKPSTIEIISFSSTPLTMYFVGVGKHSKVMTNKIIPFMSLAPGNKHKGIHTNHIPIFPHGYQIYN